MTMKPRARQRVESALDVLESNGAELERSHLERIARLVIDRGYFERPEWRPGSVRNDPFENLNTAARDVAWPGGTPVERLALTTRVYNMLKRNDLDTLADLCDADFRSLAQFGETAAHELLLAFLAAGEKPPPPGERERK